jgi:pimeloyl-ACP methyl ester carboxylesterase
MAWAELTDVRLYYELIGSGEPLLLIPGLGATCRCWDAVTPELAASFNLILMDNRGIGRSRPKRHARSLRDYAADVVELLDELQLDRVNVLGLSLGGLIAQRLAVEHPSRVDRLVLMSCPDGFSPYLRQMANLLGQALRKFNRENFSRTVELLGTSPEYMDAHIDEVEARVRDKCAAPVSRGALGRQLRCLASSEIPAERYHITAPTLVVAGERDALIPSCYAKRMAGKIPGSQYLVVPCAGHNPLTECPDVVVPPVVRFLRGRPVGGKWDGKTGISREPAANAKGEQNEVDTSLTECPTWAAERPVGACPKDRDRVHLALHTPQLPSESQRRDGAPTRPRP